MEANYYDIYTSSTRIYDKISFLMARFLETDHGCRKHDENVGLTI